MYYYQHKETGNIIGSLNNWRDFVDGNGKMIGVLTDVILPNVILGQGIISHLMDYRELKRCYKRVSRDKAFEMYPDFGQYRHRDDTINQTIHTTAQWYLDELKPIRKSNFGIKFKPSMPENLKNESLEKEAMAIYKRNGSVLETASFVKKQTNWDLSTVRQFVSAL